MRLTALMLVAAVQLGGAFGEASAEVESLTEHSMIIDLQVEVKVSASAVVAHLVFDDDPATTIPLLDRGGGVFGIRTELELKNYVVVFEAVGSPGDLSDPVSLVDLGADLAQPSVTTTGPAGERDDGGLSEETKRFGWLALALAAASLSALAFWALGGSTGPEDGGEGPQAEE